MFLPYTDGTWFDSVKNSYAENGIAPVGEETTEADSKEDKGFEDVRKVSNAADNAKKQSTRPISQESENAGDTFKGWRAYQKNDSLLLNRFLFKVHYLTS